MRWKTYRRWLFQILKTINAMATSMPQTDTVLMHTKSDNDTVRSTRRTIVRSCGICNHIENSISIQFGIISGHIKNSNLPLIIMFTFRRIFFFNAAHFMAKYALIWEAIENWKICAHWFQISDNFNDFVCNEYGRCFRYIICRNKMLHTKSMRNMHCTVYVICFVEQCSVERALTSDTQLVCNICSE